MTTQEALNLISILYDQDTETLTSGEDDYTIRLAILNAAIDSWGSQEQWRELLTIPSSPDTTDGTSKQFQLPSDFSQISGFVRLYSTVTNSVYYEQIEPAQVHLYDNDVTAKKYYITGNVNDGFYLNFLTEPDSGLDILYEYYKIPTHLSLSTDSFEMSDPMYAIYFTLSRLYESDGASSKSIKAYQEASASMEQMILQNNRLGWMQSNSIPDGDFFNNCAGFGN